MDSPDNNDSIERLICTLLDDYADCLDSDELEKWPELFLESGKYFIQSRENIEAGMDGGYWMYYTSQGMMRDRVTSLRHINTYNKHYYRHVISNIKISEHDNDSFNVRSNFLVVQTNFEGKFECLNAGEYRDVILIQDGKPRFQEKLVIADTFHAPSAIVYPL
ncbi:MAG: aromatic-ring-hydroxylating dioxygenase subunit beta [Gammaproteobacteria bacterium]|nr:aromatic-ring-hydroxylating dioxygenase subunit beta [Gammaproteobacteria bacterium]MDE0284946.1 aromatic-ring-hydroxylating dioxygenase subunit beta [Gammaproteobacteria bacterium]